MTAPVSVPARPSVERVYLIDVSRLVWRCMTGRLPTGIDRVCLAYLEHYGRRGQAVVQRGGHHFVLGPRHSEALFEVLASRPPVSRLALAKRLVKSITGLRRTPPHPGMIYFNVGHTGLNEETLPHWIERTRTRAIYMIHDLIPLTHPQYCRPGEAVKHARRVEHMLASATGIIGNSQATIDELEQFAREKRAALPPTVAAWISGPRMSLPVGGSPLTEAYFVMLGTIEGRKNHALIFDIWQSLVAERGSKAPVLVVIGQRGWEAEAAICQLDQMERFAGRLRHLDHCDDDQLAVWLAGATALLMPSFAEGFGLPVIEALQLGTPVIASDLPVFREIAGTIPAYLGPSDADGWKAAIESLIDGDAERKRQALAMRSYQAPSWHDHFDVVDAWISRL